MSAIDVTSPAALSTGVVKTAFTGGAGLNLPACNQNGTALFSWLLQLDTAASTLKTGGAKPVADPMTGYSFDDETIGAFHVQPAIFPNVAPDTAGNFSVATGVDLVMPVFLNAAGTSSVLLPMHQARITQSTLSSNNDCIGNYNAAGLDPANSCNPDSTHPAFLDAGKFDGYITLDEADTVIITVLNQSLCVLLSGNASMYGMANGSGVTVCKRDNNNVIVYQGHWCAATNAAATGSCADSEQMAGNFAASSVKILN
jgi:hypothetical protein